MGVNFRKKINDFLNRVIEFDKEELKDPDNLPRINTIQLSIKAATFTQMYFQKRFENNKKSYNGNEVRAYDKFSAKKATEYFNIYVEELLFLGERCITVSDNNYKKHLREIILLIYELINEEN